MNKSGRWLFLLFCLLSAPTALAGITATVDRHAVSLGDTLRLTITATGNADLDDIDITPLTSDFDILQRSTSSSTSIANGRRTSTRQLLLDITPLRQGKLRIASLQSGQFRTEMLDIVVRPPPEGPDAGETVLFEAEVDRERVYVQGQLVLTLRVQQAINLDNRGISELELADAFVIPLEQRSFQRSIDGRPWLIHEIRYAVFPEQSGTLSIPAQTFSARESLARRNFFDMNSGGRQVSRRSDALTIEVIPRPDGFPDDNWLAARDLRIEESWSTAPDKLRAGESTTRTISILGEGTQGAQLPPVVFPDTEGLRYYPDQPVIRNREVSSGLTGVRQDSAAIVPTRAGKWTVPELRIPWWDTENHVLRYAVLPERTVTVAAADPFISGEPARLPDSVESSRAEASPPAGPDRTILWQALAATSTLCWLITLAYLFRSQRRAPEPMQTDTTAVKEREAFKQLKAACKENKPLPARQAFIIWVSSLYPDTAVYSSAQAAALLQDREMDGLLADLNAALYDRNQQVWNGGSLADCASRVREQRRSNIFDASQPLRLYPA